MSDLEFAYGMLWFCIAVLLMIFGLAGFAVQMEIRVKKLERKCKSLSEE